VPPGRVGAHGLSGKGFRGFGDRADPAVERALWRVRYTARRLGHVTRSRRGWRKTTGGSARNRPLRPATTPLEGFVQLLVTVCVTPLVLFQVTVPPGATEIACGEKPVEVLLTMVTVAFID
jgi:hypothetical protein